MTARFGKIILKLMITQTATIKDGKITLPKEFQKSWKKENIFITGDKETLTIKKIIKPTLSQLRPRLKQLGNMISQKEIEKEIQSYRKNK